MLVVLIERVLTFKNNLCCGKPGGFKKLRNSTGFLSSDISYTVSIDVYNCSVYDMFSKMFKLNIYVQIVNLYFLIYFQIQELLHPAPFTFDEYCD